jgi:hypothetical protein
MCRRNADALANHILGIADGRIGPHDGELRDRRSPELLPDEHDTELHLLRQRTDVVQGIRLQGWLDDQPQAAGEEKSEECAIGKRGDHRR